MADVLTRPGDRLKAGLDKESAHDTYRLDRGIDSISRTSRSEMPLPDATQMPPAGQTVRAELDQLISPSLDDYQAESLQPRVADRQLLIPHRFELTLRAAAGSLRRMSQDPAERSAAAVLRKAAGLLTEEASLRELLGAYRSALYQG